MKDAACNRASRSEMACVNNVVSHTESAEQARQLKRPNDPALGNLVRSEARDRGAPVKGSPRSWPKEPRDNVHARRLPGAVWPDEAEDILLLNRQVDLIECP